MHIQPLERLMTSVQIRKAQTLWAQVYLPRRVLQYLRHNGFGSEQIPASFLHLFLSWPRRVHFIAPSWLSPKSLFNPIVQVTKRSAEALRCARPFSARGTGPPPSRGLEELVPRGPADKQQRRTAQRRVRPPALRYTNSICALSHAGGKQWLQFPCSYPVPPKGLFYRLLVKIDHPIYSIDLFKN